MPTRPPAPTCPASAPPPGRPAGSWLCGLGAGLLDLLPNQCQACQAPTRGPGGRFCTGCRAAAGVGTPRCQGCALRWDGPGLRCGACLRSPPPWARARAGFDYTPPWDQLLKAHKFHDAHDLAPTWAELLLGLARDGPAPAEGLWLIPVPLPPARWRIRGHAMAAGLARGLGRRGGWTVREDLVERPLERPSQRGLDAAARQANVRGAFVLRAGAARALAGRPLVLVDDVMTTGATLAELTRTLAAAGAGPIEAWALARRP